LYASAAFQCNEFAARAGPRRFRCKRTNGILSNLVGRFQKAADSGELYEPRHGLSQSGRPAEYDDRGADGSRLLGQSKGDDVRASCNGNVLLSVGEVCHRRSFPQLIGLEVPQLLAGICIESREGSAVFTEKD
jgi:hypothetical protein